MEQFKSCGLKHLIIATIALCMGVNFLDICFIINWGPARSILDQHQEAGRAGRDGKRANVVVINFIMGNKLDIVNKRSKILSVLKAVFVLLRINHWTTRYNLWNLLIKKKPKKSNTPPPETRDFEIHYPVDSVEYYVQELLHSMIKSLMDSVVTSISECIDGIVKDVAQLKASVDLTWKNHVNELSKTVVNFPN